MSYERDQLGFLVGQRCPHCKASLYLSPEDEAKGRRPICLNGCNLPHWQYRLMQQGLRESYERVRQEDAHDQE